MEVIAALEAFDWRGKEVLVGCSGGVDSIVLVHGLLQIGVQLSMLHVNYQLRGAESDADEALVVQLANDLNVPIILEKCPVELTKGEGVNLQNAARNYRHKLFTEWIQRSPNHYVALGHHLDDQVETFFLQYYRGSGIYGLGGMHPNKNQLVRPFLNLRKTVLYTFAEANKLTWREDASNHTPQYLRNLFRLKLLPEIENEQPVLFESLALFMNALRETQQSLELELRPIVDSWNSTGSLEIAIWNAWSVDQRFAFVKGVNIPTWAVQRLNDLADTETGKRIEIDELVICKTKLRFFKIEQEATDSPWDYKIEITNVLPNEWNKEVLYLDPKLLHGNLIVRKVQPEDRIASIGMKGTQLVSKVFKDANIPINERNNQWILTDERDVIWIPGLKVSRLVVATSKTEEIWCVQKQTVK